MWTLRTQRNIWLFVFDFFTDNASLQIVIIIHVLIVWGLFCKKYRIYSREMRSEHIVSDFTYMFDPFKVKFI